MRKFFYVQKMNIMPIYKSCINTLRFSFVSQSHASVHKKSKVTNSKKSSYDETQSTQLFIISCIMLVCGIFFSLKTIQAISLNNFNMQNNQNQETASVNICDNLTDKTLCKTTNPNTDTSLKQLTKKGGE